MGKKEFTTEEKIKAVELHIRDRMGYGEIADRCGVPKTTLRHWIRKYKTFGVEGLINRNGKQSYSAELKRSAVEEISQSICIYGVDWLKNKRPADAQTCNALQL